MSTPVRAIRACLREHEDARFISAAAGVIVPDLTARLEAHASHVFPPAYLYREASYTVFALPLAFAIDGLFPASLPPVEDPALKSSPLWLLGERDVHVFGSGSMDEYLSVSVPVAFDSTGRMNGVTLGRHFFDLVDVVRTDEDVTISLKA